MTAARHLIDCADCNATGRVEYTRDHPNSPHARTFVDGCDTCDGLGFYDCSDDACRVCVPVCEHGWPVAECPESECMTEECATKLEAA